MITKFEKETSPLSEEEVKISEILVRNFTQSYQNGRFRKENPVTGKTICDKFNSISELSLVGIKNGLSEVRLRKIINHIRHMGILPILSSSKGYYVSYDPEDIRLQIESLRDRADAILFSAEGLEGFLR
jgi:hypothetical protein